MPADNTADRIELREITMSGGQCKKLSLFFGPHHFFEVEVVRGKVVARIGATHHGIQADASTINSQLEGLVEELRRAHPESMID